MVEAKELSFAEYDVCRRDLVMRDSSVDVADTCGGFKDREANGVASSVLRNSRFRGIVNAHDCAVNDNIWKLGRTSMMITLVSRVRTVFSPIHKHSSSGVNGSNFAATRCAYLFSRRTR